MLKRTASSRDGDEPDSDPSSTARVAEETNEEKADGSPPLKRRRIDDGPDDESLSVLRLGESQAELFRIEFAGGRSVTVRNGEQLEQMLPSLYSVFAGQDPRSIVRQIPAIPPDVMLHVARFCDAPTLYALRSTSTTMRNLLDSDAADVVWERACIDWEQQLDADLERCRILVPEVRKRLMDDHKVIKSGGLLRDLQLVNQQESARAMEAGRDGRSDQDSEESSEVLRRSFQKIRWFVKLTISRMQHLLSKKRDQDTEEILELAAEAAEAAFRYLLRTEPARRRDARRYVARICSSLLFEIVLEPRLQARVEVRSELARVIHASYVQFTGEDEDSLVPPGPPPGPMPTLAQTSAATFPQTAAIIPLPVNARRGRNLGNALLPAAPATRRVMTATATNSAQLRSAVDDGRAVALAVQNGWIPLQRLLNINGWQEPLCWRLPDGSLAWRLPTIMSAQTLEQGTDAYRISSSLALMSDSLPSVDSLSLRDSYETLNSEPTLVKRARMHVLRSTCDAPSHEDALQNIFSEQQDEFTFGVPGLQYRRYVEVFGRGQDELAARVCFRERSLLTSSQCFTLVLHEAAKLYKEQEKNPAATLPAAASPKGKSLRSSVSPSATADGGSASAKRRAPDLDKAHTNTVFTAANAGIVADLMHDVAEVLSFMELGSGLEPEGIELDAIARKLLLNSILLTHAHVPQSPPSSGSKSDNPTSGDLAGNSMVDRLLDASLRGKFVVRYPTRSGIDAEFDVTPHVVHARFMVKPGWRVSSPLGDATVIGLRNEQLWFHVDTDAGASFWKNDTNSDDLKKRGINVLKTDSDDPIEATFSATAARGAMELLPKYVSGMIQMKSRKVEELNGSDSVLTRSSECSEDHPPAVLAAVSAATAGKLSCTGRENDFTHRLLCGLTGARSPATQSHHFDPAVFQDLARDRPMNAVEWFGAWSALSPEKRRVSWFPAVLWTCARTAAMTVISEVGNGDKTAAVSGRFSLVDMCEGLAEVGPDRQTTLAFTYWSSDVLKWPWQTHKQTVEEQESTNIPDAAEMRRLSRAWLVAIQASRAALVNLFISSQDCAVDDLRNFLRAHGPQAFLPPSERSSLVQFELSWDPVGDHDELITTASPRVWEQSVFVAGHLATASLGRLRLFRAPAREMLGAAQRHCCFLIHLALRTIPWCSPPGSRDPLWYMLSPPSLALIPSAATSREIVESEIVPDMRSRVKWVESDASARIDSMIELLSEALAAIERAHARDEWVADCGSAPQSPPIAASRRIRRQGSGQGNSSAHLFAASLISAAAIGIRSIKSGCEESSLRAVCGLQCFRVVSSKLFPLFSVENSFYRHDVVTASWISLLDSLSTLCDTTDLDMDSWSFTCTQLYERQSTSRGNPGSHCTDTKCSKCSVISSFLASPTEVELRMNPHNQWVMHEHGALGLGLYLTHSQIRQALTGGSVVLVGEAPLLFMIEGTAASKRIKLEKLSRPIEWLVAELGEALESLEKARVS